MNRSTKIAIVAAAIFLLPGVLIPAFVHQPEAMRRTVYLAYFFCCPLSAVIASLGKRRNVIFYLGLAALLAPIEMLWWLSYQASFVHPTQQQVANFYLPIFFVSLVILLPLGMALTYKGTRNR